MASRSLKKLTELIKQKVAHIVLHELSDPRIGFLTVTRAKLSADHSHCLIFYSLIGSDGDRTKAHHALESARGFVQRRVGDTLRTRTVPRLRFEFDPGIEGSLHMADVFREMREERGEESPDSGPESDKAAGDSDAPTASTRNDLE